MRRLAILVVSLALLWSAWWAVASYGLREGVVALLQDRRAAGWQAEARIAQSGFPLGLDTTLQGVALSDPASGNGFAADRIDLSAPAYWPGFVTLDLPETPLTITLSGQQFRLRATDAMARLRLHPGTALELEGAELRSGPFLLSAAQGALLSGEGLALTMTQDAAADAFYAFALETDAVTPGDLARAMLNLPTDWERAFETLAFSGAVGFDRPLDREAMDGTGPQPRMIALDTLDLRWGALALSGEGMVAVSETGIPTGEVTLRLAQWQDILDLASDSGLLTPAQRDQAQLLMGGLANIGGEDGNLEITLSFADGQMALGPIQLGPAPRIAVQ